MDEEWKRELGNGRWDKILKRKMTELSVSDDYNEAKHEWVATGNVWWRGCGEARPHWAMEHPDQCLCSHNIVYHFEIHNTENHIRECVGSDHINSYLIIRAIEEEQNISRDAITEEMIEEWVKVNVSTMKKNAWWNNNGERFESMFNEVKDLDLRVNVRPKGNYYDSKVKKYVAKTVIRKTSSGQYGSALYKMGSIVWRWNHPDNARAQILSSRGYPNDRLLRDINLFSILVDDYLVRIKEEDKYVEDRKKFLDNLDLEIKDKLRNLMEHDVMERKFLEACLYFGFPVFDSHDDGVNSWERGFLRDMKRLFIRGGEPSEKQAERLKGILISRNTASPTRKQLSYLQDLGYEGDLDSLTRKEASDAISMLKERRWNNE